MWTIGEKNLKRMWNYLRVRVYPLLIWGAANDRTVIAIFETNDPDEFVRIFNDPATAEAMAEDKITGGVEMFLLDETFNL